MKRVAVVKSPFLPVTETFIYNQILHYKQYNPIIFTMKPLKNIEQFSFLHSKIYNLYNFRWKYFYNKSLMFNIKGRFPYFEQIIKKENISIIQAHFGRTGFNFMESARKLNVPLITYFYGSDVVDFSRNKKNRKLFSKGDLFIALSESMKMQLISLGCPSEKIRILDVGINLELFQKTHRDYLSNKNMTILSAGRFVEKKGYPYLLKAFSEFLKDHNNITLRLVGDGPERQSLERLAKELKISKEVYFLGNLPYDQLIKQYYDSDIFILPSCTDKRGGKDELSTVLKEAMAAGMPIITTNHAGICESLNHKKNCIIVPEKDYKSITKSIALLLSNPTLVKILSQNSRKTVEQFFNVKNQMAVLETFYDELLERKKEKNKRLKRAEFLGNTKAIAPV